MGKVREGGGVGRMREWGGKSGEDEGVGGEEEWRRNVLHKHVIVYHYQIQTHYWLNQLLEKYSY